MQRAAIASWGGLYMLRTTKLFIVATHAIEPEEQ
jgi:hypothetical protein